MKSVLAYEKMWGFQKLMLEDIATSKDKGKEDPSQFALRTNIRTSLAYIEGTIYQLRLVCTAASEDAPQLFSESEILLLKEKSVSLDSKGKVKEKDSFQKPIASVLFLFSLFSRIHNIEFKPNLSDHKWDSFQKFFKVRNDLTILSGQAFQFRDFSQRMKKLNKITLATAILLSVNAYAATPIGSCPATNYSSNFLTGDVHKIPLGLSVTTGTPDITSALQSKLTTMEGSKETLVIPKGTFQLGEIKMPSGVRLWVHEDTTLKLADGAGLMFNMEGRNQRGRFLADNKPLKDIEISSWKEDSAGKPIASSHSFTIDYNKVVEKDASGNAKQRINQVAFRIGHINNFAIRNVDIQDNYSRISSIAMGAEPKGPSIHNIESQEANYERKPNNGLIENVKGYHQAYGYGTIQMQSGYNIMFKGVHGLGGVSVRLETGSDGLNLQHDPSDVNKGAAEGSVDCVTIADASVDQGHAAVMISPHAKYNGRVVVDGATATDSMVAVKTDKGFDFLRTQQKVDASGNLVFDASGNKVMEDIFAKQKGHFSSITVKGDITGNRTGNDRKATIKWKNFSSYDPVKLYTYDSANKTTATKITDFNQLPLLADRNGDEIKFTNGGGNTVAVRTFAPLSVVYWGSVDDYQENKNFTSALHADGKFSVDYSGMTIKRNINYRRANINFSATPAVNKNESNKEIWGH